eukprot:COSAG06_NODE_56863_length_282_cov_8.229508_1_plen_42_part_01
MLARLLRAYTHHRATACCDLRPPLLDLALDLLVLLVVLLLLL